MANVILKPTVIINTALGLLQREIVVPSLVWADAIPNWSGAFEDTVSIRVPGRLTARSRALRGTGGARSITLDTVTQTKVDVTLDEALYSGVPVTDEELSLDIEDFASTILAPQVRAVAEGIENKVVAAMRAASYETTVVIATTADANNVYFALTQARKALNDAHVPMSNRKAVFGSAIEAALLNEPQFTRADHSGDVVALNATQEAKLGRIAGFDIYMSAALDEEEGYAFHSTAYVLGLRAPSVPQGVTFGESASYQGLAMRWIKDYDFANVQDRSLVDVFAGTAVVQDDGAVLRAIRLVIDAASIAYTATTHTFANNAAAAFQLIVTATLANGDTRDVTSEATYVSATPAHATVDANGLVTPVAAGTSVVTATFEGATATFTATVTA